MVWQIDVETVADFIFLCSKITVDYDCSHDLKRGLLLGRKATANLDSILKCRDITLLTKVHLVKTKKDWAPKNWCLQTVVLEKILESPLDSKEIKPVSPRGSQPWIVIGRTDAEAEAPIFCSPDAQSRLIGKDPDAGSGWSPGEGNGSVLQYSCLGNLMDRRAWRTPVHGVAKSWTQLSD